MLAIAFATAVLMFFMSIQLKSYDTGIRATTSLFHGHMQVQPLGYFEKPQMRKVLKRPPAISRALSQDENVASFAPRVFASVLAASEDRSYGAQVMGIDPGLEPGVSTVSQSIRSGEYLSSEDTLSCVIGTSLAKNLKVSVGSEISIIGQGFDGSLASAVLRVKGIYETGSPELDRLAVQMPLKEFNEVFTMNGAVHTFAMRLKDFETLEKTQIRLRTELQAEGLTQFSVLRWDELLPGIKQSMKLDMSAGWMFFGALIIIVCFSVLNTFLMSILERTKEFGVVLSLGMRPGALGRLIVIEGIFLAFVGISVGVVLGSIVVESLHYYGFTIPGTDEIRKTWNLPATLYPDLTLVVFSVGPLVLFAASICSCLYPAFKTTRVKILDALRGV